MADAEDDEGGMEQGAKLATANLLTTAMRIENTSGRKMVALPLALHSAKEKDLVFRLGLWILWLPDLDSNQGPAD